MKAGDSETEVSLGQSAVEGMEGGRSVDEEVSVKEKYTEETGTRSDVEEEVLVEEPSPDEDGGGGGSTWREMESLQRQESRLRGSDVERCSHVSPVNTPAEIEDT